jgi:hypothetical protein
MAKARRRRRRHVRGGKCGIERVRGHKRRVCRNSKGRITSNQRVGGRRRRRSSGTTRRRRRKGGRRVVGHCPKGAHPVKGGRCQNRMGRFVAKVRSSR